jgi:hypothetical protein
METWLPMVVQQKKCSYHARKAASAVCLDALNVLDI